jgi:hypothetical protein
MPDAAPVIQIDTSDLVKWQQALSQVSAQMQNTVIMRTLNWVGDKMRTQVIRATAEQAGVPYGRVKAAIETWGARPGGLAYELHAKGGYLTFASFNPVATRDGVRARPWGVTRDFPHAFIIASLAPLAFIREGDHIRPMYGPSIAKEMGREEPDGVVPAVAFFTADAAFPDRLEHELNRVIASEARKRGLGR